MSRRRFFRDGSRPCTVARKGYANVTLKEGLIQAVDRFIETNQEGFTSRAEVISTAVREFLRQQRSGEARDDEASG